MLTSPRDELSAWLASLPGLAGRPLRSMPRDASDRRYWRVADDTGRRWVVMDAPGASAAVAQFSALAGRFAALGLHVPAIRAADPALGGVLLEDLGERHYLDSLDASSVERLYGDALGALLTLQACAPHDNLPVYDAALIRRELGLFDDWLLRRHLGLTLDAAEQAALAALADVLVANMLAQPQVCVHRDFHSRNLMVVATGPNPGILDFQDAVLGPVTYDLVSLLRDCYIAWPAARVEDWAWGYFEQAVRSGVLETGHEPDFLRWFDLTGAQRHLKAAGIFARLARRDGRQGYLADIPRTLNYVLEVASRYSELAPLQALLQQRVLPALQALDTADPT